MAMALKDVMAFERWLCGNGSFCCGGSEGCDGFFERWLVAMAPVRWLQKDAMAPRDAMAPKDAMAPTDAVAPFAMALERWLLVVE